MYIYIYIYSFLKNIITPYDHYWNILICALTFINLGLSKHLVYPQKSPCNLEHDDEPMNFSGVRAYLADKSTGPG